jgi:hypothetical protein
MAYYALRFDDFALQIINLAEALYYAVCPSCFDLAGFSFVIIGLATQKTIEIYEHGIIIVTR